MSIITVVKVKNVRSHGDYVLHPDPTVTIITGLNGSGKTSLLEAVYVALRGTSFKGSDSDILSHEAPWWRIDLSLGDDIRTVKFDPSKETGRKQFTIDEKISYRIPPKSKYPVVLFEPDDLRLLSGSPARRRKFIDTLISQIDPQYGTALRKYERSLKQRNNLLKTGTINDDELFAWNVSLAENGSYIISQRQSYINTLNEGLEPLYGDISGTDDKVSIMYSKPYPDAVKQSLLNELQASRQRDVYLGNTSVGPHRHDVIFHLNSNPAQTVASRGESRTIVLALKFLEVGITEKHTGKKPVVLLDDVFSELDATRQKLLTDYLKENQILITSATSLVGEGFLHVEL